MAKKKKQTIGYRYFASGHFVLCHGPIDAITKISFQDKDAYLNEESENKIIFIDKSSTLSIVMPLLIVLSASMAMAAIADANLELSIRLMPESSP